MFDETRTKNVLRAFVPVGRILFAFVFLLSGFGHFFPQMVEYARSEGVPLASIAVPLSGAIAVAGGASIALGYRTRLGAGLIVLFLVPVTLMMHRFWAISDPEVAQLQMIMFLKNTSMLGGALLLAYFGAGPFSFDALRVGKRAAS
jgi:putative oxidoreductase